MLNCCSLQALMGWLYIISTDDCWRTLLLQAASRPQLLEKHHQALLNCNQQTLLRHAVTHLCPEPQVHLQLQQYSPRPFVLFICRWPHSIHA